MKPKLTAREIEVLRKLAAGLVINGCDSPPKYYYHSALVSGSVRPATVAKLAALGLITQTNDPVAKVQYAISREGVNVLLGVPQRKEAGK